LVQRLCDAGAQVIATRTRAESVRQLEHALGNRVTLRVADLGRPETLRGWIPADAVVVVSAPPRDDRGAGETALVDAAAAAGASRIVYLSSTGVYPPGAGRWIEEDVAPDPATDRGLRRLAAESALRSRSRDAAVGVVCLRVAGIYGPERGVAARLKAGTYRVIGPGSTYVSRIHVEDLVTAIIAAGTVEGIVDEVINAADDAPTSAREHADGVAALLGVPTAPTVGLDQVSRDVAGMMTADRRISNIRLKRVLGVSLRYPSWRQGVLVDLSRDPD
jgi:nucleoside-diphosphate-sugar epimerase